MKNNVSKSKEHHKHEEIRSNTANIAMSERTYIKITNNETYIKASNS